MMTILVILAIGIAVWAAIVFGSRSPKSNWVPVATAVMVGLSVYFLKGMPGYPDHPVQRQLQGADFGEVLEDPRKGMIDRFSSVNGWLVTSDGLIRTGDTQSATMMLQQGIRRHPESLDLWLAFANALVAHGRGQMTPAAAMAFDKAARLNPDHPGPPFFAGLALAQSGDYAGARRLWTQLKDRSPADAPWLEDLNRRLAALPPAESPQAPSSTSGNASPATDATETAQSRPAESR